MQIGASEHDAEIHWVHVKEGTESELLVVGVLFDTNAYGANVEVSFVTKGALHGVAVGNEKLCVC